MSKYYIGVIVLSLLIIVGIVSKCNSDAKKTVPNNYEELNMLEGYEVNDDYKLSDLIETRYSISDLEEFFQRFNESALMYTEVDLRFPIEVLRTNGYTVYKVAEGGYFYVFWQRTMDDTFEKYLGELYVDSVAYLSSSRSENLITQLKEGCSNAKDVQIIDPYVDFNFTSSSGVHSYTYINESDMLEIVYQLDEDNMMENLSDYDEEYLNNLVIQRMKIVPRNRALSRYRMICSEDLPE